MTTETATVEAAKAVLRAAQAAVSVTQEELRSQFVTDQIVYKRAYDDVAIV